MKLDRDGLLLALGRLPTTTESLTITRHEVPAGALITGREATLRTKIFSLDAELAEALPSGLATFRMDSLFMSEEGARALGMKLAHARELEVIEALMNDDHLIALTEQLRPGQLDVLRLQDNSFGEDGIRAALSDQNNLTTLDLSWNSLSWLRGEALAEVLGETTPPLRELNLSKTKLWDLEMFEELQIPTLRVMRLANNRFTESPLPALATIAPNLVELDLSDNKLDKKNVRALREDDRLIHLDENPGARTWRMTTAVIVGFILTTVFGAINDSWTFVERLGGVALVVAATAGATFLASQREQVLRSTELRQLPEDES